MALGYEVPTRFSDSVTAQFWVPQHISFSREGSTMKIALSGWTTKADKVAGNPPIIKNRLLTIPFSEVQAAVPGFLSALVSNTETIIKEHLGWDTATDESDS